MIWCLMKFSKVLFISGYLLGDTVWNYLLIEILQVNPVDNKTKREEWLTDLAYMHLYALLPMYFHSYFTYVSSFDLV